MNFAVDGRQELVCELSNNFTEFLYVFVYGHNPVI